MKVLNNLVWELLDVRPGSLRDEKSYTFTQPKRRWVHVSITAEVADGGRLDVAIDGVGDVVSSDAAGKKTYEAMRFLRAGEHVLKLQAEGRCRVERVVVRSVPELIYSMLNAHCLVREFPRYDETFLARYVHPNVNTIVFGWSSDLTEEVAAPWIQRGGKWLMKCGVPTATDEQPLTVAYAQEFVARANGFQNPFSAGALADEFGNASPMCGVYAEAVRRLKLTPEFKDKAFYAYATHLYKGATGIELTNALVATGGAVVWKRYLKTPSSAWRARAFLRDELVEPARAYRKYCPGSLEHMVVNLGHFSIPREFLGSHPGVNYKAFLDMAYNIVANDPAFWGTFGLVSYVSSYTDDETARWVMRLFRHYGIEGNSQQATNDPYVTGHLLNADFAEGSRGWQLEPAQNGGIRADLKPGFGWLQGRYPFQAEGDTVLVTVRSAKGPNVFGQEMRGLTPGKMYSFRMYTGDFRDMSKSERHAVRVQFDNVDLVKEKCLTHVFKSIPSHRWPLKSREKSRYWMNYHWRVFRARGPTARVTVSDWSNENEPGGAVGQELMYNYVSVQPYFEE